jgi:hypothetical protein
MMLPGEAVEMVDLAIQLLVQKGFSDNDLREGLHPISTPFRICKQEAPRRILRGHRF